MRFLHYPVGWAHAGDRVRITLSQQANVHLLDNNNLQRYRRGQKFRDAGGRQTASPAELAVPRSGHWHVVGDCGTAGGRVRATVELLRGNAGVLR